MRTNYIVIHTFLKTIIFYNGKEATINRALDGSTASAFVHSVFCTINYGCLKHNSLYLRLVLPSGG
jgi:hypothetical protein